MKFLLFVLMLSIAVFSGFSQGHHHGNGGYLNPDSLTNVTLFGTAIVDTSTTSYKYYLDEDDDGTADYFLNFGPYWYKPDSSIAVRPADGDAITIFGGLVDSSRYSSIPYPVVIVYEIDGEFWRDPFIPLWSHMGGHGHYPGHHGHAFGWQNDSLTIVQVSGTVLLDTTFINVHYYLDENNDGLPNYILNFGPPWYQPEDSTLTRPEDGDVVYITGGLIDRSTWPMIIVFELDGQTWRDSTLINQNLGGQWIHRNMNQHRFVHAPFDTGDGITVNPGWNGNPGGMLPDSLFCRMLQLYPQNIPNSSNQNAFAGYELGVFNRHNMNLMNQNQHMGGQLQFANQLHYRFHYNDIQILGNNINENTIELKIWDNTSDSWHTVNNAILDVTTNTITFSSSTASSLVILTGETSLTSLDDNSTSNPGNFILKQNYPNPFNPVTNIEFTLANDSKVVLTIYNALGQKLFDVVNTRMKAGVHNVQLNAESLSSGIYFYKISTDNESKVKKMTLIK